MWLKHIKLSLIKPLRLLCQINSNNMIGSLCQIRRLSAGSFTLQLMELLLKVLAEIILTQLIVFRVLL